MAIFVSLGFGFSSGADVTLNVPRRLYVIE